MGSESHARPHSGNINSLKISDHFSEKINYNKIHSKNYLQTTSGLGIINRKNNDRNS